MSTLSMPTPAATAKRTPGSSPLTPRNFYRLIRGEVPGQVIIQITDACNAQCPQCEMRVNNPYPRADLEALHIERTLEAAAARKAVAVSFTGGEPFLKFELMLKMIHRAGELGIPFIRTGTNGYFLRHHNKPSFEAKVNDVASRLAETQLRNLWFSVDSADPAVHNKMRGLPGAFEGMVKALPIFREHEIYPTANLGVNRNTGGVRLAMAENPTQDQRDEFYGQCLEAFRRFYSRAEEVGFTIVNFCYPMSVESEPERGLEAVYRASSSDDVVKFRRDEKAILFRAMAQAVGEFRNRIRIFTPRNMLHSLAHYYETGEEHGYACRGGRDFFFVSAVDGGTYPCGFRSDENLGNFWELPADVGAKDEACTRCDWECFRDPSNNVGPMLELAQAPTKLLRRVVRNRRWSQLWWDDIRYQRAAEFCNGRKPPNYARMARFAMAAERNVA